ncbi:GGDEF domain-containing protein [Agrobacterium vaccinii]|uniref:GGDEF domain-containing protein n=1 Tax=Agrobacterium vaccinii TaxID=2735528 RepID=UPI001E4A4EE9|nr:GGDEF domain-containing protein [Agrobacterium vaccinii]UHS56557.1 GGDEF domain-containing protein [Agrobacterium vaccinii]UHS61366.1 GGDEF domain-containing protein [Agrobacterium vaccinii]
MMQPLDLPTVLLLHKLSFFVAALCFLYVRSQSRESVGLGFLAIGFFLVAMASTLVSIGKLLNGFENFLALAGSFAGLVGYSIFWIGMCRISTQRRRRREWLVLCLPVFVCTALFLSGSYVFTEARTSAFQATAALLLFAAAFTVFTDRLIEPLPVRKALAATIAFAAFLSALVVVGIVFPTIAFVSPRNAFFVSIVCHFAIAVFVLALVKERAEEGLKRLADLDVLTGVPNRRSFSLRLPEQMRQGDVIVMTDIDHFKRINDGFGHFAGDEVLVRVARELSARIRPNDSFARFGGEEFILFLPATGEQEASTLVESVRQLVSSIKHTIDDQKVVATLSMGLAVCEEKYCTPHALMKMADTALYASKSRGRDRLTVYRADEFAEDAALSHTVRHAG